MKIHSIIVYLKDANCAKGVEYDNNRLSIFIFHSCCVLNELQSGKVTQYDRKQNPVYAILNNFRLWRV